MKTLVTRSDLLLVLAVVGTLLASCKVEQKAPPAPASSLAAAGGTPSAHGKPAPASLLRQRPGRARLAGRVLEHIDAAGYTYLKLQTAWGATWAAVRKTKVNKGDSVRVVHGTVMPNFKSKTLERTFPLIVFGRLAKPGEKPARRVNLASAHTAVKQAKAKLAKPLAPATAANARTVGQIYAQRQTLANKTISVRGKVTKVNRGILGRNWLHLQDGTSEKGAFDLTVTTQGIAKLGDVVVAEGTLRLNKGFGAGYSYVVLLENAKVTRD
ncbi:MAG: hypothetical protein KC503_45150 [Myxococcales bacterium]|nr:hypothetical protein [Myxococcales bacterium]